MSPTNNCQVWRLFKLSIDSTLDVATLDLMTFFWTWKLKWMVVCYKYTNNIDELWSHSFTTTPLGLRNMQHVWRFACTCLYFLRATNHVLKMASTYLPCHRSIDSPRNLFSKHSNNIAYASLPLVLSVCQCLGWLAAHAHVTSPTFSDASMCRWTSGLNKHMHCIFSIRRTK